MKQGSRVCSRSADAAFRDFTRSRNAICYTRARNGGRMRAWLFIAICVTTSARAADQQSVDAATELRAAIDILKTYHMNRDKLDWPAVEARASADIKDKPSAADAYPAIRDIIKQLGEKHTSLAPAEYAKATRTGTKVGNTEPPPFSAPEAWALRDSAILLRVPGFQGPETDDRSYVITARRALKQYKDRGICRFVIDLRGNWGGNMYPMLNALRSFLGQAPYGYWIVGPDKRFAWNIPDWPIENGAAAAYEIAAPDLSRARIAILLDRYTASAGEFTAMALQGLPHMRSFGSETAGYLTANEPKLLPDGAEIFVSTSWGTDRLGHSYRETLVPDSKTAGGQPTVDAALTWLKSQPCH